MQKTLARARVQSLFFFMTTGERLKQYAETKGITLYVVAKRSNISTQIIYNFVNGVNQLSLDNVSKLVDTFDDLDPRWLLTGKGAMIVGEHAQA